MLSQDSETSPEVEEFFEALDHAVELGEALELDTLSENKIKHARAKALAVCAITGAAPPEQDSTVTRRGLRGREAAKDAAQMAEEARAKGAALVNKYMQEAHEPAIDGEELWKIISENPPRSATELRCQAIRHALRYMVPVPREEWANLCGNMEYEFVQEAVDEAAACGSTGDDMERLVAIDAAIEGAGKLSMLSAYVLSWLVKIHAIRFTKRFRALEASAEGAALHRRYHKAAYERLHEDLFHGKDAAERKEVYAERMRDFKSFRSKRGDAQAARARFYAVFCKFGPIVILDPYWTFSSFSKDRNEKLTYSAAKEMGTFAPHPLVGNLSDVESNLLSLAAHFGDDVLVKFMRDFLEEFGQDVDFTEVVDSDEGGEGDGGGDADED